MRRLILTIAAALSLSGCAALGSLMTGQAPAPLAHTAVDEKGIVLALKSADTIATIVDSLVAAKVIVPGTPLALTIKHSLIALRDGLAAASAAQRAGNATSYAEAMSQASTALGALQAALGR